MKIIDLTQVIRPSMPVYPGTETPVFINAATVLQNGFAEKKITLYSHTGTHMDAPAHMIRGGKTLDQYSPDHFVGQAVVIPVTGDSKGLIGIAELDPYKSSLEVCEYVLFHTGWDTYWGQERYFEGYPVLTSEAVGWLTDFKLKGLGFDAISPDPISGDHFPIHHLLFQQNLVIVENLTNLDQLAGCQFEFCCLPLKIEQADGGPVRAIAILK